MSTGFIILSVLILLIMFGAGQRVLDRMRLSDTWALIILVAIAIGLVIPPIKITKWFEFSIGGFLIPFGVSIYLMIRAGWSNDLLRAFTGIIVSAGLIIGLEYILPADPEELWIDPVFVYAIVAALVAYLLGRSRRNAFICAVVGISLAKLIQFIINWSMNTKTVLSLGAGGAFDTIIIATLLAVGLCEIFGESLEKLVGEKTKKKKKLVNGEFVDKNKAKNKQKEAKAK